MALLDKKNIEDIEFTPAGAAIKIVRSAISMVMIGFMLVMASNMFSAMAETGDGIIVSVSKSFFSFIKLFINGRINSCIKVLIIKKFINSIFKDNISEI